MSDFKFSILYASSKDMFCLFTDWLKLLKLNLPEFLKTLKSPHNLRS